MPVDTKNSPSETGTRKNFDVASSNFSTFSHSLAGDACLGDPNSAGEGAKSRSNLAFFTHTPPESAVFSFVVRALDSERLISGSIALAGKVPQRATTFFMDSGANETMMKDRENFLTLDPRKTAISTATAGSGTATGVYGTPRPFTFDGGKHRVVLGGKAVWCDKLNDNLLSVGRLCDAGFSVAFLFCFFW